MQDEEIKEKTAKIEHAEKCLTTLKLELKVRFLASEKCLSHYYYEGLSIRQGLCFNLCISYGVRLF